jgi:hypothetical protein
MWRFNGFQLDLVPWQGEVTFTDDPQPGEFRLLIEQREYVTPGSPTEEEHAGLWGKETRFGWTVVLTIVAGVVQTARLAELFAVPASLRLRSSARPRWR